MLSKTASVVSVRVVGQKERGRRKQIGPIIGGGVGFRLAGGALAAMSISSRSDGIN